MAALEETPAAKEPVVLCGAGCGKPASMVCPTCKKLGVAPVHQFCGQPCFEAFWPTHKQVPRQSRQRFRRGPRLYLPSPLGFAVASFCVPGAQGVEGKGGGQGGSGGGRGSGKSSRGLFLALAVCVTKCFLGLAAAPAHPQHIPKCCPSCSSPSTSPTHRSLMHLPHPLSRAPHSLTHAWAPSCAASGVVQVLRLLGSAAPRCVWPEAHRARFHPVARLRRRLRTHLRAHRQGLQHRHQGARAPPFVRTI